MPRTCSICCHPKVAEINLALLENEPLLLLALRMSVSKTALLRHKASDLPRTLARARRARLIADGDFLLAKICGLQRAAERVLAQGEATGDGRLALLAIRELRAIFETLGRMPGNAQAVGSQAAQPHSQLREVIVHALKDHPAAKVAVADALSRFDATTP